MFDLKENSRMLNSTQTFKKRSDSGCKNNDISMTNDNKDQSENKDNLANEIISPEPKKFILDKQKE